MSTEQRENLDAILRLPAFPAIPAVADVNEQRRQLKAFLSAQPLPADMTVTEGLGGVPIAEITVAGIKLRHIVLYFAEYERQSAGIRTIPVLELRRA